MNRRRPAMTLLEASQDSPVLARLTALADDSRARWRVIESLIPPALRTAVTPGPIDGASWCLLVQHNAAAAKLRQLQPALLAHLRGQGWEITAIRLKVQSGPPRTGSAAPGARDTRNGIDGGA